MGTKLDRQPLGGSGAEPNKRALLNVAALNSTAIAGPITLDAIAQAIERLVLISN